MKLVVASKEVAIPEGITVEVKARKIRVKGPRGEWPAVCEVALSRQFSAFRKHCKPN